MVAAATKWKNPHCFSIYHYSIIEALVRDPAFAQSLPVDKSQTWEPLVRKPFQPFSFSFGAISKEFVRNPAVDYSPTLLVNKPENLESPAGIRIQRFKTRLPLLFRGTVGTIKAYRLDDRDYDNEDDQVIYDLMSDSLVFSHRSIYEYLTELLRDEKYIADIRLVVKCIIS